MEHPSFHALWTCCYYRNERIIINNPVIYCCTAARAAVTENELTPCTVCIGIQYECEMESLYRPKCVRVCVYTDPCGCMTASVAVCVIVSPPFRHSNISIYISSNQEGQSEVPPVPCAIRPHTHQPEHTSPTQSVPSPGFDARPPGAAVRQRRRSAVTTQLLGSICHRTVWLLLPRSKEFCNKKKYPGSQTAY